MKVKLKDLSMGFLGNDQTLMLSVIEGDARTLFDEYGTDRELELSLSIPKKKRSLDANAYAWVLIGKLAAKIHQPKEQVYREIIRDLGDNYEVLQMRTAAIEAFDRAWTAGHVGRFTELLDWDDYTGTANVTAYYGSSDYDTKTMSRLIDRIIEDCQTQGIETMTPAEQAELLRLWGERYGA